MARKKKHEEHENHERWLVSYADFITLLFAFFTSMYAISSVNEGKFRVMSESIAIAFNPSLYSTAKMQPGPRFVREQKSHIADEFKTMFNNRYQKMLTALKELEKDKKLTLIIDDEGVTIRMQEGLLFEPGSDRLLESGLPVLDELSVALQDVSNEIWVEGHTDNIPISTPQFPSNWELSSSRSIRIIRYLIENHRFDPARVSAIGYGEFRPIESNDSPAGRKRNRRVDILVRK